MKKILGLALVALVAFGGASAFADPTTPSCDAPVDVSCRDGRGTSTTADDRDCLVYVNVAEAELAACENAPA